MADLPDIDVSEVGWIAYYNVIDQGGAADIDPEDVLSSNFVNSYEIYDNGVKGTGSQGGRTVHWRAKNDGWLVAYFKYEEYYDGPSLGSPSTIRGPWDLDQTWTNTGQTTTIENNALERSIASLYSNLSNSGNIDYFARDVGLYHYQYTAPNTITMFSMTTSGYDLTGSFLYTQGTDIHLLSAAGYGWDSGADGYFRVDGSSVAEANGDEGYGSRDLYSDGITADPDTEFNVALAGYDSNNSYNNAESTGTLQIYWS